MAFWPGFFDASGTAAGPDFVVNSTTASSQSEPSVAALSGGGFVVAYRDDSGADGNGIGVLARIFDASGTALGPDFVVNSTTASSQFEPSVAALSGGGFVVAYTDSSSADGNSFGVLARIFDASGTAAGPDFVVNTTFTGPQLEPSVTALSGGGFVVAYRDQSGADGDPFRYGVLARIFDASGTAASPDFIVNTTTSSDQYDPSVAELSGGGFIVAYTDNGGADGNVNGVLARHFDASGAALGAEFVVNTTTANNQLEPSVAALSGGGFAVTYRDNGGADGDGVGVLAQRFSVLLASEADLLALDAGSDFQNQTVASEVGAALSGDVILDFGLADAFNTMGAGGVVEVAFTLNNATFSSVVPSNAWTAASDADCDFGSPVFGGGAGGNTVRFENTGQLNQCSGFDANDGFLTLPIEVTNNGDPVSINVTFTPTADAGSYTGSDDDIDLLAFAPAFDFSITAGAGGAGEFDSAGDDLQGTGLIGTLTLADFPADIESDIGVALADATDIAASAQLVLTFPGGVAGIDETNIDLGGVACTQGAAPSDNVFTCTLGGGILDAIDNGAAGLDITIDDDANAATFVTAQTPSAVLTVTGNPGNTVSGTSGDLADIELDDGLDVNAITNSNFDWVRFGSSGTESNFRIALPSAAEAQAVTELRVAVIAGNGVSAGTVTLVPGDADSGFQVRGATITFNSRALSAASGETGNANITSVSLQHDEAALLAGTVPGLSILRQLVNRTPGSFVATPGLASDN